MTVLSQQDYDTVDTGSWQNHTVRRVNTGSNTVNKSKIYISYSIGILLHIPSLSILIHKDPALSTQDPVGIVDSVTINFLTDCNNYSQSIRILHSRHRILCGM